MISYIFSDNFEKAKEKLKKYEWTSDIATDDNENIIGKRNKTKPKKYITTSSESADEESTSHATINKKIPPRPPQIVKNTLYNKSNIVKAVSAHSSSLSHCQTHLKETSTPVNLIEEVTTNTEEELENGTSLFLHKIYLHTHTHTYIHNRSSSFIYFIYLQEVFQTL